MRWGGFWGGGVGFREILGWGALVIREWALGTLAKGTRGILVVGIQGIYPTDGKP